ncbi:MAG: hypothetical protein ACYTDT_09350 [Planctomycetota bacterium]|jgi:hypothetical protein
MIEKQVAMRITLLTILGMLVLVCTGCGSTHSHDGEGHETRSHPPSRWGKYLEVMTDKERDEFFGISDTFDRNQWIRTNGMDVRVDLAKVLSKGMSKSAAKKSVKDPVEDTVDNGDSHMAFYSRFNTVSRTNYYLVFHKGKLASWHSYTREDQDRNRELFAFESKLMRKFDTVLEVGMGVNEIRRQAENARNDLNRVKVATRDVTSEDTYKGVRSASYGNYIIAEQLLLAESRNELFKWFQGRDADKIVVQRPYENHQYYMVHKDLRGNETVVIAEFVFRDGLLKRWFVYHEL